MRGKQDAPKDDSKHSTPPKPGDKDGQVKGPSPSPREPKSDKHASRVPQCGPAALHDHFGRTTQSTAGRFGRVVNGVQANKGCLVS